MRDRQFIWMNDMPVGYLETVYRVNGSVLTEDLHYITSDHLNAPAFATNQSGVMTWKWDRDAFGLGELDLDPDGDGVNVNIRLRFPGQYDDEESITFYNYFRDYDPTIGRYMQSDPIGLIGGMNTFIYLSANPVIAVDPLGLYGCRPAPEIAPGAQVCDPDGGQPYPEGYCPSGDCAVFPDDHPGGADQMNAKTICEIDREICVLNCNMLAGIPVAVANAVMGGGIIGSVSTGFGRSGFCVKVCE